LGQIGGLAVTVFNKCLVVLSLPLLCVVNGLVHDEFIATGLFHRHSEQQRFAGTRDVVSVLPSPTSELDRVEHDAAAGTVDLVAQAEPWQIVWLMHRYCQT